MRNRSGRKRGTEGAGYRERCYRCYRPKSTCMCEAICPVETQTKFVILMHNKEFQKTKNGTGIFSHLALPNSELFVGIDFSEYDRINAIVEDENNNCYILYPSSKSQPLNTTDISKEGKTTVIFIIDSTWACAKKMMRLSRNITDLPHISFLHERVSMFHIKEQPADICLSTMESIHCVLELLNAQEKEQISEEKLDAFLNPFHKMVAYQMQYTKELHGD